MKFRVVLEVEGNLHELRAILKTLLRRYGWKCVAITEVTAARSRCPRAA